MVDIVRRSVGIVQFRIAANLAESMHARYWKQRSWSASAGQWTGATFRDGSSAGKISNGRRSGIGDAVIHFPLEPVDITQEWHCVRITFFGIGVIVVRECIDSGLEESVHAILWRKVRWDTMAAVR